MQFTRFGNTGMVVSRLSFGAMTFGSGDIPAVYKVDAKLAETLVGRALEAGVNLFDTADAYAGGESERLLGSLLAGCRGQVYISTKVGMRSGTAISATGLSRGHILASCEASLKRLKTDYIDLYLVHRFDPITPLEETLRALEDLVRGGSVRSVGFSNWAAWQAALALGVQERQGWSRFVGAQMYYSLVGRDLECEVLPLARAQGLGTMIWGPLAGGFLSGKYSRERPPAATDRLSGFDFLPLDKERGFRLLKVMRSIGSRQEASVAQVALAWLLTRPGVSTVLLGASTLAQLNDNLGALRVTLTPEERNQLEEASPGPVYYPNWFTERLTDPKREAGTQP